MLKIYGIYGSRATRPLWLLEELKTPFELVRVVQANRVENPTAFDVPLNTRSPQFLAINPMGSIPSMNDDGFVLHESLAITLYLARKYGGEIGPKDTNEDALMMQWSLFVATSVEASAVKLLSAIRRAGKDSDEGKAEIAASATLLTRPFDVLERHLSANEYMVGGRFTVADINVVEVVRYAQGHADLFDSRPALKAWMATCQARHGFKAMWAKRTAEAG